MTPDEFLEIKIKIWPLWSLESENAVYEHYLFKMSLNGVPLAIRSKNKYNSTSMIQWFASCHLKTKIRLWSQPYDRRGANGYAKTSYHEIVCIYVFPKFAFPNCAA